MKQSKLIGQAIEDDSLEKTKKLDKGFGDQNSRIVNAEVFANEDAIMGDLDGLFGSLNFKDAKDIQEYLDKQKKK